MVCNFEKDMGQAMKWFRSSAELGNAYAAYQMGQLLLLEEGGSKDVETAMKMVEDVCGKRKFHRSVPFRNVVSERGGDPSSSG